MTDAQQPLLGPPVLLTEAHDLVNFDSGETVLDDWLRRRAWNNLQVAASRTYVVCPTGSNQVVGYFSLSMGQILAQETTGSMRRNMPKNIPAVTLGRLAIAGAVAAIGDGAHFERTRRAVLASREILAADLAALGFEVLPSTANFLFARHPGRDGGELAQSLRERGIIVRHFEQARIRQFLRISVGTDAQCRALAGALREILGR